MKKKIFAFSALGLTAVCVLTIVGTRVFVRAQKRIELPTVVSKVEKLTIVNQRLENADTPAPGVVYQLRNDTDSPVVAITFESGNSKSGSEFQLVAHTDDLPYLGLAHEVFEITMPLDPGPSPPLRLTAVAYADGTTAGEPSATKFLKRYSDEVRNTKLGGGL
jgi:hypothetical protein